jgi:hypothetical protein
MLGESVVDLCAQPEIQPSALPAKIMNAAAQSWDFIYSVTVE